MTGFQTCALPIFPLSYIRRVRRKITVPPLFLWSDGDPALLEMGARDWGRYVSGVYRFEVRHGSHGLLDELCLTVAPTLVGGDHPRTLSGPDVSVDLDLHALLEQDGTLLGRWLTRR